MSSWDWVIKLLTTYWPQFLKGTGVTLLLAVVGTTAGLIIGLLVGIVRTIPLYRGGQKGFTIRSFLLRIVNIVLAIYIEIFRGTPMMVQAVLFYFGLPQVSGIEIPSLPCGLLVITLNTGAYMSEIVRGGIHSIDAGQNDAAKAIGMTHWQTMFHVILPQTIRNILPATGNEFIVNLKDSSVLSVIMVVELFYVTTTVKGIYYRTFESFFIALVIYLILTFTFSRLLRLLEHKMDGPKNFNIISSSTTPVLLKKHGKG